MMKVVSPLTGDENIEEIDKFPVANITEAYRSEFGLSVSKYFKGIEYVSLYKCKVTGYRFYFPFDLAADGSFYEQLMNVRKSYYPGWKWENKIAAKFIKDNDRVLDVGCGDGAFIVELSKHKKILGEGLEFNDAALEKARVQGVTVFSASVQDFSTANKNNYDVVTSFQVLEHIAEPKEFLSSKLSLLKPGGLMIVGVPFSNPYLYKKDRYHTLNLPPHHMGLWDENSLKNLGKIFPMEMIFSKVERVDDLAYYTFVQFGAIAKYKALFAKYKWFRVVTRMYNKIFGIPFSFLKGRTIVAVFKKS